MMRDIMQNASLEWFAEIGLALFFIGFFFAVLRAAVFSKSEVEHASALPLADDTTPKGEQL
jgi:cbb3-type cytochrome oxidase subunit 3